MKQLVSQKRNYRLVFKLIIGLTLIASLLPVTKANINLKHQAQAETIGETCIVANQATKDKLSTQAPYDQMTIEIVNPADTISNTTHDAKTVCMPDLSLKSYS